MARVNERDDERRLAEIEAWFRSRAMTLWFSQSVGDREPAEWVALMIPDEHKVGVASGGVGVTKLAAAEDAQARELFLHGGSGTFEGVAKPSGEDVHELPPEVREPLDRVASSYGWSIAFVDEPDGSIHWFVFDIDRALVNHGVSATWDDARLVWDPTSRSVIGKFFAMGDDKPFRYPEVWEREPTDGPDRLLIGGGEDPVKLLVALAQALSEPLFVLAVIHVSRDGDPGKYESEAMTHADVASFFDEFGKLFSDDGRAEAWIGSMQEEGGRARDFIVLDNHDLLYAYGPLDEFERILRDRGFTAGLAEVPAPHEHHYNPQFDTEEARLREWSGWSRVLPLEEED
jgi:hypothetical protein